MLPPSAIVVVGRLEHVLAHHVDHGGVVQHGVAARVGRVPVADGERHGLVGDAQRDPDGRLAETVLGQVGRGGALDGAARLGPLEGTQQGGDGGRVATRGERLAQLPHALFFGLFVALALEGRERDALTPTLDADLLHAPLGEALDQARAAPLELDVGELMPLDQHDVREERDGDARQNGDGCGLHGRLDHHTDRPTKPMAGGKRKSTRKPMPGRSPSVMDMGRALA